MQRLISIAFGNGNPILKARDVGRIYVGNHRIGHPAVLFLVLLLCAVDDDAYGKQVVHSIEVNVLFLHLVPDGVDRLGAALYFILQSAAVEGGLNGLDEVVHILVALFLSLIELMRNLRIHLAVEVFKRQVFKF